MYFSRAVSHCHIGWSSVIDPCEGKMTKMLRHVAFERLADLAEGRPRSAKLEEAQTHISGCERCGAAFTQLARVMGLMRNDISEEAPPELLARTVKLFRSRAASSEPSLVRRLVAALKFDSAQMSPAYGVRSGQKAEARQVLYNVQDYDVDLRIASGDQGWSISGQAFGPECAGGRIELEGDSGMARAELTDQCEFHLPPVPTGSYTFRLHLTNLVVEIPELELRADGA